MRIITVSVLALAGLTGCMSLQARIPEDAIRQHMAREEGIELGSICSFDGRTFSEGAVACMSGQRLTCDPAGRWARIPDSDC